MEHGIRSLNPRNKQARDRIGQENKQSCASSRGQGSCKATVGGPCCPLHPQHPCFVHSMAPETNHAIFLTLSGQCEPCFSEVRKQLLLVLGFCMCVHGVCVNTLRHSYKTCSGPTVSSPVTLCFSHQSSLPQSGLRKPGPLSFLVLVSRFPIWNILTPPTCERPLLESVFLQRALVLIP